ncbi:DUF6328 family protein [Rhodococcus erythropolis]
MRRLPTTLDETRTNATERKRNGPGTELDQLPQELCVAQTGVQILTGFLLALPFQPHVSDLTSAEKCNYLATQSFSHRQLPYS